MKPINTIDEKIKVENVLSSIQEGDYCGRSVIVILRRTGWFLRDLFCKGKLKWRDDSYVYKRTLTGTNAYTQELSVRWACIYIPRLELAQERVLGISDMHEIVPGLFLGNQTAARDPETMRRLGIRTIICCTSAPLLPPLPGARTINMNHGDEVANISLLFPQSYAHIEEALKNNGKVLVHCSAGASRSASQVIAFLMKKYQLPFQHAFHYVRSIRPIANPADKFKWELRNFERVLNQGKV